MFKMEVSFNTDPGCPLKVGKDVTKHFKKIGKYIPYGYASWMYDK